MGPKMRWVGGGGVGWGGGGCKGRGQQHRVASRKKPGGRVVRGGGEGWIPRSFVHASSSSHLSWKYSSSSRPVAPPAPAPAAPGPAAFTCFPAMPRPAASPPAPPAPAPPLALVPSSLGAARSLGPSPSKLVRDLEDTDLNRGTNGGGGGWGLGNRTAGRAPFQSPPPYLLLLLPTPSVQPRLR
jgi:hypothetical protein